MYKGKSFGTPFKKKGVHPLVLREISTWGWYLYEMCCGPPKAGAQPVVVCDILSHVTEKAARSAAATYCRIDNYLLDSPPKGGCDTVST